MPTRLSASNRQRAATLRQQLTGELGRFDYVFVDCPPSLGQLTRAALGTSAEIYIPIQCEYFAMEGLSQIIELARQTKASDNTRLEIGGIVLTMFDPALELANEVADEVREYFAETVFESLIPRDVSISEAPSHGLSVLDYAPRHEALGPIRNSSWRSSTVNKRRLGRGLEALLGREEGGFEPSSLDQAELIQIAVDQIDPNPFQPRRQFNVERDRLAGRFPAPARHAPAGPGQGSGSAIPVDRRRAQASREYRSSASRSARAGHSILDDQRVFELAMVENLQREDLNAIDKATRIQRIPLSLRRHPGRARWPARPRPIDHLQPDSPPRPAATLSWTSVRRNEITQGHARRCWASRTPRAGPPPANGSSPNTSRCDRPRPWSPPESRPRHVPGSAKTQLMSRSAKAPHLLDLEQRFHRHLGTPVLIRPGIRIVARSSSTTRPARSSIASPPCLSEWASRPNSRSSFHSTRSLKSEARRARPTDGDGYRRP